MKLQAWKIRKGDVVVFKYNRERVVHAGRCDNCYGRRKRGVLEFLRDPPTTAGRMECDADAEYEVERKAKAVLA